MSSASSTMVTTIRNIVHKVRLVGINVKSVELILDAIERMDELVAEVGADATRNLLCDDYVFLSLLKIRKECAEHLVIAVSDFADRRTATTYCDALEITLVTEKAVNNPFTQRLSLDKSDPHRPKQLNYHEQRYLSFINSAQYWVLLLLSNRRGDSLAPYNDEWLKTLDMHTMIFYENKRPANMAGHKHKGLSGSDRFLLQIKRKVTERDENGAPTNYALSMVVKRKDRKRLVNVSETKLGDRIHELNDLVQRLGAGGVGNYTRLVENPS